MYPQETINQNGMSSNNTTFHDVTKIIVTDGNIIKGAVDFSTLKKRRLYILSMFIKVMTKYENYMTTAKKKLFIRVIKLEEILNLLYFRFNLFLIIMYYIVLRIAVFFTIYLLKMF